MLDLWTVTYAFKRCNLAKFSADILFKFQQQIKRVSFSLWLSPGFTSTSPLKDTRRLKKRTNEIHKMVEENKIETRNCLLFFDTLSFRKNKTLNSVKIRISYWQKLRSMLYKCYFCILKWQNCWLWIYSQYSYCWEVLLSHNIEKF